MSAPTTTAVAATAASAEATCQADITVTGGWEGHVTGSVSAAPRRIGVDGQGVSIDAFFDMPQQGAATRFLLSIFDPDRPNGPKGLTSIFGEVDSGVASHAWEDGVDPVSASLAADGSSATFDLEFGRLGHGPGAHVIGSIDCLPLP